MDSADQEPVAPDTRTADIVGRLRERLTLGKDAEKRLVETILSDLQFAAFEPIARIAERARVSEPTITRLARSIGFSGTREMRLHLAQALAIGGAYLRPDDQGDSEPGISEVIRGAHAALDLVALGLAETDMAAIGARIAGARRILICGTGGGSSMAAVELQNRLFRLGLAVSAQTDPQLQRMNAATLRSGDTIIGFSLSGRVRSVQDALRIAGQYGAETLAVTPPDSPIQQASAGFVPLTYREDHKLLKPSSARFALLAVVDGLALSVAQAMRPAVTETLRRVRQSLAAQDITDPNLPVGD